MMPPCQETCRGGGGGYYSSQEQEWGNASIIRQDSLTYSVSDAGSQSFDECHDESFEMYCDRMNSKEVVVIFGENFDSSSSHHQVNMVWRESQQAQTVDTMIQQVQALRLAQQQESPAVNNKTVNDRNRPWQFPQPASNKENAGVFRPQHHHSTTAMAS